MIEVADLPGAALRAALRKLDIRRVDKLGRAKKGSLEIMFYGIPGGKIRFYTTQGVVFENADREGFQQMLDICDVST